MSICKFLTGKDAKAIGSKDAIEAAVHEAISDGIAQGQLAIITFDGKVMHLVRANTLDPESSLYGVYDTDEIGCIEVMLVAGAGGQFDVELTYNDEPVVIELED